MREIAGEASLTVYCGVDFPVRQQTICYFDTTEGAIKLTELGHEADDVRGFYAGLKGEVIVGLEGSGYSTWSIELVEGLGHTAHLGDASEIRRLARRRQKNNRRGIRQFTPLSPALQAAS